MRADVKKGSGILWTYIFAPLTLPVDNYEWKGRGLGSEYSELRYCNTSTVNFHVWVVHCSSTQQERKGKEKKLEVCCENILLH